MRVSKIWVNFMLGKNGGKNNYSFGKLLFLRPASIILKPLNIKPTGIIVRETKIRLNIQDWAICLKI